MKQKLKMFVLCLSFAVFLCSSMIYASEKLSVTNDVNTGVVDIELDEYTVASDGSFLSWENDVVILPGMNISKIPRITNVGYDCYVRATLDFSVDGLDDSYFDMGEYWQLCKDGYWYYTKVLPTDSYTDIFQGIQIPEDFSQVLEGERISLEICVDAIQAKNFIPDYDAVKPWGNVTVQSHIQNSDYQVQNMVVENPKTFELQYDVRSKSLMKNEDDFFQNIPVLFPGDTYTDTLELQNENDEPMFLYFSTFSEENEFLNQVQLMIYVCDSSGQDTLIYDGNLASTDLESQILLTKIDAHENQQLKYTITVSSDLDNSYTLLEDHVRWMFSVDLQPVDDSNQMDESNMSIVDEIVTVVQTSDVLDDVIYWLLILCSGFLCILFSRKKKQD